MRKRIWRSGSARRVGSVPTAVGLVLAASVLFATISQPANAQQPSNEEIIRSYTEPAPKPQGKQRSVDFVTSLSGRGGQTFNATAASLDRGFVVKTRSGLAKADPTIDPPSPDVPDMGSLIEQRAGITGSGDAERATTWIGFAVALALLGMSAALELRARRRHSLQSRQAA